MKNDEEGFDLTGRLLEKPLLSFADLNKDGKYEILFRRRVLTEHGMLLKQ